MSDNHNANIYPISLDRHRQQIRVLTLCGGTLSDTPRCSLSVVSLLDKPVYNALSYAWGPKADLSAIEVDGFTVNVTHSLEAALRNLRHPTEDRVMWVDAICINQGSVSERNSQVSLMGDIYRAATQVLIWLGEADDMSDEAFDLMPLVDVNFLQSEKASSVWSFYAATTRRPYMGRVWIIQEFVLATQDPIVVCGHKQVTWSTFMSAYKTLALEFFTSIDMVKQDGEGRMPEVLAKLKYDSLDQLREAVIKEGGADLRQLLIMSRTSESSEPRDRIYGLMQLLDDEDQRHFVVDYNKPTAIIYAEAMSLIFKHGDGPQFLDSMWCPSNPNPLIPDLPSWVPDFSSQTPERASLSPPGFSFHPPFPHSASGAGADADNGRVLDDLQTLQVEALLVDTVEDILHFEPTLNECIPQLTGVEHLAEKARLKPITNDQLRPLFERFRSSEQLWRTLICNKQWNSGYHAAPDTYESEYRRLLRSGLSTQDNANTDAPTSNYIRALEMHVPRRTFFTTSMGLVGVGMPAVQKGDEVTIWFGARTPFLVRPSEHDASKHRLIGPAYIAGVMEGQAVDESYCDEVVDSKTLFVL